MKKIFYLLTLFAGLFAACSKDGAGLLDKAENGDLTEDKVFSSALYTKQFLAEIYHRLPYDWDNNVFLDACTDDGKARPYWGWSNTVNTGAWNASNLPDKFKRWADYYAAIRACNMFLSKIDSVPLDPEQYMNTEQVRQKLKYEGVCLRALYYEELVRWYGGVPLITKVLQMDSPELYSPRANLKQMKDFIVAECDSAAKYLPYKQTGSDYHRVGAVVAKAIKARLLLHLASPLFNSTPNGGPGELSAISWGNYDANRWKEAADAARDLIDFKSVANPADNVALDINIQPNTTAGQTYLNARNSYGGSVKAYGFYEVFVIRKNSEIILSYSRKGGTTNELDKWLLPGSIQGGGDASYTMPTMNFVGAFETKNGVPVYVTDDDGNYIIDPATKEFKINPAATADGFDPQNPYVNRDSRFYHSIWYQGSMFSKCVFDMSRSADGSFGRDRQTNYPSTGFYLRKFMDPKNVATNSGTSPGTLNGGSSHCFPIFRLAEFNLGYAEALNEYLPDGADRSLVIAELDKIRTRSDMPTTVATAAKNGWLVTDKKAMRKFIRNERRVELAFENDRFFDIRRWKIGGSTQKIVYMQDQLKDKATGKITYSIKSLEARIFKDGRDELIPIPQSEVNNNPNMVQNPGW